MIRSLKDIEEGGSHKQMGDLAMKTLHGNVSNKYRTSQDDKVRVCFYGRVSTQHEAQMNALENQMQVR